MNKIIPIIQDGNYLGYMITSPATNQDIVFDNRWKFNGDFEKTNFYSIYVSYLSSGKYRNWTC